MSNDPMPSEFDKQKLLIEQRKLELERDRLKNEEKRTEIERQRPFNEGLFKFADLSVRSLLILNGGAAIGLLTFAASASKNDSIATSSLASCVIWFASGAALSVTTAALSYLAQVKFQETPHSKWGPWLRRFACLSFAFSLGFFMWGMWQASNRLS